MENSDFNLGFLLSRAARSMKRALDAKLSQYSITSTQYIVLEKLWEADGLSLTELGKCLDFDGTTITGISDRMERDGLVVRRRKKDDRRVINIFLTEKGKKLKRSLAHCASDVNSAALGSLSEPERTQIGRMLESIWEVMTNKETPAERNAASDRNAAANRSSDTNRNSGTNGIPEAERK
ncbi:MAG: MarR family transcriptional regulator [Candidatus Eiseniibacteriota bacterium]|nr:MAG: MarR family transcriptional regulator [Candidatus Eisenbacteria bacterium]